MDHPQRAARFAPHTRRPLFQGYNCQGATLPRVYGYLEGRYHHDVVFLSRAKTGHGMTIFAQFPRGVMSKGEISADLLCEERRLHELAAQTCAASGEPPPVVVGVELLSDPRWNVVACSPRRPLADAAARDAVPVSAIEFIERRRAAELKSTSNDDALRSPGTVSLFTAELKKLIEASIKEVMKEMVGLMRAAPTLNGATGMDVDVPPAPRPAACSCTGLGCGCGFYH